MAKMSFDGLDDVVRQLSRMGLMGDVIADEMLIEGAVELKTAWQNSISQFGHVDTGTMRRSVGFGKKPIDGLSTKSVDIYPIGKDKKGVRNAEKAFVLHYGRSNMTGSHFVDKAETEGEPKAFAAMEARWDRFIQKGS